MCVFLRNICRSAWQVLQIAVLSGKFGVSGKFGQDGPSGPCITWIAVLPHSKGRYSFLCSQKSNCSLSLWCDWPRLCSMGLGLKLQLGCKAPRLLALVQGQDLEAVCQSCLQKSRQFRHPLEIPFFWVQRRSDCCLFGLRDGEACARLCHSVDQGNVARCVSKPQKMFLRLTEAFLGYYPLRMNGAACGKIAEWD